MSYRLLSDLYTVTCCLRDSILLYFAVQSFGALTSTNIRSSFCQTMSIKRFLLAVLAGTLLIQSASSEVSCNGRLDHECCKGKNKQQCFFKELGTDFKGACLDLKVSLLTDRSRFVASYILLVATVCEHTQLTSPLP
jgi:hypothetical protein